MTGTRSTVGGMSRVGQAGFLVMFVLVWSSGYIAGSIGTREANPAALGLWRFVLATTVLGGAVLIAGRFRPRRWPRTRRQWLHLLVIGALLQNVQFTGAFLAISLGMPAGLAALIADATPLVVAVGSTVLFGEALRRSQVAGVLLGVVGVCLVVSADITPSPGTAASFGAPAVLAAVIGLVGAAAGTLYQKGAHVEADILTATFVQLIGATVSMVPVALLNGGIGMPLTLTTVGSVLWLACIGSILAFVLLFTLLRVQPGAQATSYLFLVPPVTAVLGAVLLDQPLTTTALIGFAVAAAGVALVVTQIRQSHRYAKPPQ